MRLIDADAVKFTKVAEVNGVLTHVLTAEDINNAPTVEPETKLVANVTFDKEQMEELVEKAKADILAQIERPQGEWINHRTIMHDGEYYCSNCDEVAEWLEGGSQFLSKYCPNCGAKMRGGAE